MSSTADQAVFPRNYSGRVQNPNLTINYSTLWEWESAWIQCMAELKCNGIKIDREFSRKKAQQGETILREIREELGWNPGSPKQIGEVLLNDFKFPIVRYTENGNPSFDKYALDEYMDMLEATGSDLAKTILRYRGWQITTSMNYKAYLEYADKDDIIHPEYKLHHVVTGRLSCERPNLQQIPRESEKEWNGDLKQAFIPRESGLRLIEFDYGQLETRLAAAYAGETELLEAFWNDEDVFQTMADTLGWKRQDVKLFNYMTLYGAGVQKLATVFNINKKDAAKMRKDYYEAYPGLQRIAKGATNLAHRDKYVEYWTGRRRHFAHPDDYRKAWNSVIQGGAFEIVKRSMLRLRAITEWPMVLQVHDSVVLEMPKEVDPEPIRKILEAVPESEKMGVPFKVEWKEWRNK